MGQDFRVNDKKTAKNAHLQSPEPLSEQLGTTFRTTYKNKKAHKYGLSKDGVEGSRTPVQKPIHRPSTIVVRRLGFPLSYGGARSYDFGSFMIRPYTQSFAYVVSCLFDAGIRSDRYIRADGSKRLGCC